MEEKQSKKLAKVLSKLGLDEEKINEVFEVIDKEDDEEEVAVVQPAEEEVVKEDEEVSEVETAPTDEEVEEEQVVEEPVADEPVEQEVNEGEVEQVEETEPVVEEEKPIEEQQAEIQPEPVVDPVNHLQERLDEALKVIDGFNARISSLEEELSKAGVLRVCQEKPAEEVGVDESSTETSKYASKSFDEILRGLNR